MDVTFDLARKVVKAAVDFNDDAKAAEKRMKKNLEFAQNMGSAKRDCDLTPQERFDRDMRIAVEANGKAAGQMAGKALAKLVLPPV